MLSMIVFSALVRKQGSRKAVSGMRARGFLRRNSVRYVVEVVLRTEALPFQHFHNGGDLPHLELMGFRGLSGRY